MIFIDEELKVFHIQTENTSYIMKVLPSGHLCTLYYGDIIDINSTTDGLRLKHQIEVGGQVVYDSDDSTFNLNLEFLELPTYGKGDFREPMMHFRLDDGSRITDFKYSKHEIKAKPIIDSMPETKANQSDVETLVVTMTDSNAGLEIELLYTPIVNTDVIARRAIVKNVSQSDVTIEKALSMNLDLFSDDYFLTTFDGAWIRERMINKRQIGQGITKIDSKKGVSSADHNPFIVISEDKVNEKYGKCYGFGLIYSGNFEAVLEKNPYDLLRVQMGINSFDFYWRLKSKDEFITPEVVMSFSSSGFSKLSINYHELIKQHIIKPDWNEKERPVLYNNWEATMFDFNEHKLLKLAKKAKKLGIELFVLDDGWFGARDNDTSGLGDWTVNRKKIPSGIDGLARKINRIGLDFGIWVEPEMVNPESELFKAHQDWAIKHPKITPRLGRHQLILDLSKKEVRDYLTEAMETLIEHANIKYVKWDMNRNFTDLYSSELESSNQGALLYLYQLGLYEILNRLTNRFPEVLFESCASGGNRFDMGMLQYMPQIWTSDNTDGYHRQLIQYGTSFLYPQSVMGAHVSDSPSAQAVRKTPLETRFNISAFGILGYEFDLTHLTPFETKVIQKQIAFYKEHRKLMQFGEYYRLKNPFESNGTCLAVVSKDRKEAILGLFNTLQGANGSLETIDMHMLDPNMTYDITNRKQYMNLSDFGYLVKHALPVRLNPNGVLFHILKNRYLFETETELQTIAGDILVNKGFIPKQNFIGSGINQNVRLMGDFGSRMYYFKTTEGKHA